MSASPRIPVLLLAGPDPALLDSVAERLAGALSDRARIAALRNGMPPRATRPVGSTLVVRDAGAACACCVGEVAARVALARLLREGAGVGGWQRLLVLAGPGAHASRLATLLGGGSAHGSAGLRGASQASPIAAALGPPRCIAVVPAQLLGRLATVAPPARRLLVDALESAEAWLVDPPRDAVAVPHPSTRPSAKPTTQPATGMPDDARVPWRPRISWDALVAMAGDPGISIASLCNEGGPPT